MKKPILEISLQELNKYNAAEKIELLNEHEDIDILVGPSDLVRWMDINVFSLAQSEKIKILANILFPHECAPYHYSEIEKIENLLRDFNQY